MINEVLYNQIEGILKPFLEEIDIELIELNINHQRHLVGIQIFVDKKIGGITLAECTALNRNISNVIEEKSLIVGGCTVEVSSPGVDRDITSKNDFDRVINRLIHCYLNDRIEEKMEHEGTLKEVKDAFIVLEKKTTNLEIPFKKIIKAKQII